MTKTIQSHNNTNTGYIISIRNLQILPGLLANFTHTDIHDTNIHDTRPIPGIGILDLFHWHNKCTRWHQVQHRIPDNQGIGVGLPIAWAQFDQSLAQLSPSVFVWCPSRATILMFFTLSLVGKVCRQFISVLGAV